MTLFINTTEQNRLIFSLSNKDVFLYKDISIKHNESDHLLSELNKVLKKNNLQINSVKKIVACLGPGGFTSTRAGIAFALGLSFGLNIKIFGIKKEDLANTKDVRKISSRFLTKDMTPLYTRGAV